VNDSLSGSRQGARETADDAGEEAVVHPEMQDMVPLMRLNVQ